MRARMSIALLSLIAGFSAVYLHLYKIGAIGTLTCGTGGCQRALFSRYGWFMGVDVALIGIAGYALLLATSLLSLSERGRDARWPVAALVVLGMGGFLFTVRLKYGEFLVLKTFCPWCAISAVSIIAITILAVLEWRRRPGTSSQGRGRGGVTGNAAQVGEGVIEAD